MNRAALLAVVLNFVIIGGLPVFFFRRDGKLNLMWWLTGGPFFICLLVLLGAHIGVVPISPLFSTLLGPYPDLLAVPFSLASRVMLFLTLVTHRISLALSHHVNAAPP